MAKRGLIGLWLVCIVFLISIMSAQSINVNYPDEVSPGQEFDFVVELVDFDDGMYDVKIDIVLSSGRVAKIWNNGMLKSTFYYVNDAISADEEKSFSIKINEDAPYEIADIIIKIKDSSENTETFEGYSLEIIESSNNDPDPDPPEDDSTPIIEEDETANNGNRNIIHSYVVQNLTNNSPIENTEPQLISLGLNNSKDIKTENYMQEQGKSNYAIYGLFGFCVFLAFLYLVQKNRNNKNEFK